MVDGSGRFPPYPPIRRVLVYVRFEQRNSIAAVASIKLASWSKSISPDLNNVLFFILSNMLTWHFDNISGWYCISINASSQLLYIISSCSSNNANYTQSPMLNLLATFSRSSTLWMGKPSLCTICHAYVNMAGLELAPMPFKNLQGKQKRNAVGACRGITTPISATHFVTEVT